MSGAKILPMLTAAQAAVVAKIRRRLDPTPPHTVNNDAPSIRAARAVVQRRITKSAAAREFGVSRAAVYYGVVRLAKLEGPHPSPHIRERAEAAARYAHDSPCTRDRAAQIFGLHIDPVNAAWKRLYPDSKRMRTYNG